MFIYRDIVFRLQQGEKVRAISRSLGIGRNTLKAVRQKAEEQGWLIPKAALPTEEELAALFSPLSSSPESSHSLVMPYQEEVKAWVEQGVRVTAVFAALKRSHEFTGSYGSVLRFVRTITQNKLPEAFVPLHFDPGSSAQVDFGKGPLLLDPVRSLLRKTWIFVMTLCFSRHAFVCFVFDQSVASWLSCHRRAFEFFGGVPSSIILDNLKAAIVKACYYDPQVQKSYYEFAEAYHFLISPCRVATPEHKGRVESGVKYVSASFLPLRTFRDIQDADRQVLTWCLKEAGTRTHGSTHKKPIEVFTSIEKSALKPLPESPFEIAAWKKVTVHPDCHVVFQKGSYSVPFRLVGKTLWLRATDTTVQLYQDHQMVSIHPRLKEAGVRSTRQEDLPPFKVAWLMKTPTWCLEKAREVGPSCTAFIEQLLGDKVVDRLRAAQGVLRFSDKYGAPRLEAACERALRYHAIGYQIVKGILKKGLDETKVLAEKKPDPILKPRYGRPIGALLQLSLTAQEQEQEQEQN